MPRTAVRGGARRSKKTTKKTPTRSGAVRVTEQVCAGLADEYGQAEMRLARLMRDHPEVVEAAELAKKLDGYKVKLRKQGPAAAAEQGATGATPIVIEGTVFEVTLAPAGKKQDVDNRRLLEVVGVDRFLELARVTIQDVTDYVPKPEREGVLSEDPHGGTRKLNVRPLAE